jgi:hypothetical protein
MTFKKSWIVPPNVFGFRSCAGCRYINDGNFISCTTHTFCRWDHIKFITWVDLFKEAGLNILDNSESKLKLPDWW